MSQSGLLFARMHRNDKGFTLIEVSIVLVIIGLIVGGVLVGVDMVNTAKVRATVGQFEKLKTGIKAFRLKFNAIPGDMLRTDAMAFGLTVLGAGGNGLGDGNGLVTGPAGSISPEGEILLFWRQLADAGYVEGGLGANGFRPFSGYTANSVNAAEDYLPRTKLHDNNFFVVYGFSNINYFQILPLTGVNDNPAYVYGVGGMSPINSFYIDTKLDDGFPRTGGFTARRTSLFLAPTFNAVSTINTCLIGTNSATDTYNLAAPTGGNDRSCSIQSNIQ